MGIKAICLAAALLFQGAAPQVTVSGRVTAGEITRSRVIRVALSGPALQAPTTAIVEDDGTFELSKVPPGSYSLFAFAATSVSEAVTVEVGGKDVTNLAIRLPDPKPTNGRITVQGNLPSYVAVPRLAFALAPIAGISVSAATVAANPQPDGSFTLALPPGERQFNLVPGTVPAGYKLTSFTYGTTDLLKNPIRVGTADRQELRVTFDASAITSVKVSGRVENLLTTQGVRVVLTHPVYGGTEANVEPDGSFAFAKVIPGNYTARLSLSGLSAAKAITVSNQDLTGVVITYPRDFIVTGHILVEGGSTEEAPSITLDAKDVQGRAGGSTTTISLTTGVLMLNLKDGQYNVAVRNVPAGYQLKSIMYGTTDLQKAPLKIDGPVIWEVIVRLRRN